MNIALVDIPENAAIESFHETTAINGGLSLKWFTDIDAARAWLKSKQINGSGSAGVTIECDKKRIFPSKTFLITKKLFPFALKLYQKWENKKSQRLTCKEEQIQLLKSRTTSTSYQQGFMFLI
jgi:hypothetical protein